MQSFSIQVPQKIANNWRIKRDGISAIKFEAAQIHFLSDVFVAVAVVVALTPSFYRTPTMFTIVLAPTTIMSGKKELKVNIRGSFSQWST